MRKLFCLFWLVGGLSLMSCTKECTCADEDGNMIGTVKSTNNDCEEACKELTGHKETI